MFFSSSLKHVSDTNHADFNSLFKKMYEAIQYDLPTDTESTNIKKI